MRFTLLLATFALSSLAVPITQPLDERTSVDVRGLARPAGRGLARPAGRGLARPAGRGLARPAGRGLARPAGRGLARPAGKRDAQPLEGAEDAFKSNIDDSTGGIEADEEDQQIEARFGRGADPKRDVKADEDAEFEARALSRPKGSRSVEEEEEEEEEEEAVDETELAARGYYRGPSRRTAEADAEVAARGYYRGPSKRTAEAEADPTVRGPRSSSKRAPEAEPVNRVGGARSAKPETELAARGSVRGSNKRTAEPEAEPITRLNGRSAEPEPVNKSGGS